MASSGGGALVVGTREIDRITRCSGLRPGSQYASQRHGVAIWMARLPVQPADHGLLVDADLLGQPPSAWLGDAVAQQALFT